MSIESGTPRHLIGRPMSTIQARALDWLWIGWIVRKYITLFVGESGAGKSTVLADIVARITTGLAWPGETEDRTPGRVLWLASEDGASDMTVPRLMACNADGSGPHSLDSAAADVRWNLRANVMLPKTET